MGFVEIVSLLVLLLIGLAGLAQGVVALLGRAAPAAKPDNMRLPRAATFLVGGLAALFVGVLWLFNP